jgi:3D (Asp-Asp-Asp) domain-containing protein
MLGLLHGGDSVRMTRLTTAALMGAFVLQSTVLAFADTIPQSEEPSEPIYPTYTVSMTGYNALVGQTDSTPNITASGAYTHPEVVAARSVDLADELPYGTIIEISRSASSTPSNNCGYELIDEQLGLRVIADSMHPRKRKQIDVLLDHTKKVQVGKRKLNPAIALGHCKGVEIKVVGKIDIKKMPKTQAGLRIALEDSRKLAEAKIELAQLLALSSSIQANLNQ